MSTTEEIKSDILPADVEMQEADRDSWDCVEDDKKLSAAHDAQPESKPEEPVTAPKAVEEQQETTENASSDEAKKEESKEAPAADD